MTIDRAEQAGLGASVAAHVLLFAVLYAGYHVVKPPEPLKRPSMEVSIVAETGMESGAPEISTEAPAPKLAEEEAPLEPEPPAPVPEPTPLPRVEPQPVPKPTPKPVPKPVAKVAPKPAPKPVPKPVPAAKSAPAKAAPAARPQAKPNPQSQATRSGGRLTGILDGITDDNSRGRATKAPATTITPAVQSSLAAAVRRQLKPHWKAPTGADAEQLRTELAITLGRDGSVQNIEVLRQSGVTASNRAQAPLHKEQAIKAVRLASPFQLPAQYYDAWKVLSPIGFDKRLAQ